MQAIALTASLADIAAMNVLRSNTVEQRRSNAVDLAVQVRRLLRIISNGAHYQLSKRVK